MDQTDDYEPTVTAQDRYELAWHENEGKTVSSGSVVYAWQMILAAAEAAEEHRKATGESVIPQIPDWCWEYLQVVAKNINELTRETLSHSERIERLPRALFMVHGKSSNAFKAHSSYEKKCAAESISANGKFKVGGARVCSAEEVQRRMMEVTGLKGTAKPESIKRMLRRFAQEGRNGGKRKS